MPTSDWMNKSAITSSVSVQFGNNCTLFYRETAYKIKKYMITPINALITFRGVRASTEKSAQCYQTDFSSDFSGWARDYHDQDHV